MKSFTKCASAFAVLLSLVILFSTIVATPTLIGAQVQSPSNANATGAHKIGVKIVSPSANTTVPAGELTIHGVSSDSIKTNCRVFVDWNDLKPMQNVTAKGPGGANDYSNWTYTYTDKYHVIALGINELTSKITCFDNPSNVTSKYYSINITGLKNNTISPTLPSSGNISFGFHNAAYLPQYDGLYHNIIQPIVKYGSTARDSSNNNSPDDNNDESKDQGDGNTDATNDDNENNHDSQSQTNGRSGDVNDDSSSGTDSGNKHSNGGSQHDGNKEHRDSYGKKHDNNESKDKGKEKHKGAHPKNLKAHKH